MRKPALETRRGDKTGRMSTSRRLTNLNEGEVNSKYRLIDNPGLAPDCLCTF